MRKAAVVAFHESDCDQAIRVAALAGRRRFQNWLAVWHHADQGNLREGVEKELRGFVQGHGQH